MAGGHTGSRPYDLWSPFHSPFFILPYDTYQPLTKYIMYPISNDPDGFYTGIEIVRRQIPLQMSCAWQRGLS